MSMRFSHSGPPSRKTLSSGNAVEASWRIALNHALVSLWFTPPSAPPLERALSNAFVYVSSDKASSLPIARCQTAPLERGVIPRHHSSLVRCSDTTRSQSGKTYSSHIRCSVFRVSSFLHCAAAASAAFRLSTRVRLKQTKLDMSRETHTSITRHHHHPLILL